ncbi:hypothetical protein [Dyadobacter sp. 3J3]|uniref:hypothetical protein n=1 Tax=Dyadobacter sp. 3J3 TaxID=2606600 RepID=UPI001358376E|nr:hypothetical protein [Dyadobacter sp. 3J3]
MTTELLNLYKNKISFKSLVTDQHESWQKAVSLMFLVTAMLYWGIFIGSLYKALPDYLLSLVIAGVSFLFAGGSLKVFQARIIRRDYPQHYINWYSWDKEGMHDETCKAQRVFNKYKQWDRHDEENVQSILVKEIERQGKSFEHLISVLSNIYSKIYLGVVLSLVALFHENVGALVKILFTTFVITILLWLSRIFFKLIWDIFCTNIDELEKINRIFERNKMAK